MRLVDNADRPPRECAVSGRGDGPFIDFQTVIETPQPMSLYVHTLHVEEAAKMLGMVPAREVEKLREDFAAMSTELDRLRSLQTATDNLEEELARDREKVSA
jgi:hypothetical protein